MRRVISQTPHDALAITIVMPSQLGEAWRRPSLFRRRFLRPLRARVAAKHGARDIVIEAYEWVSAGAPPLARSVRMIALVARPRSGA